MLNWYALNSKPHREKLLRDNLTARGIENYLPLWRPYQRHGRRGEWRPYFTSYLFARADLDVIGLGELQYLPGLRQIVFRGDRPATVVPAVIDALRQHLAQLDEHVVDAAGRPLQPGDRVVIAGGPLDGYEGLFDKRLSSGERVRVLINFLQACTPCELEVRHVQKQVVWADGKPQD